MTDMYPPDPNVHVIEITGHEDYVSVSRSSDGTVSLAVGEEGPTIKLSPQEARDLGAHLISAGVHHEMDDHGYAPKGWDERTVPTARQLRDWLLRCAPSAQESVLRRLLLNSHEGQLCYEADHAHLIRSQEQHLHAIISSFNDLACQLLKSGNQAGYKVRRALEGQFRERTTGTDS